MLHRIASVAALDGCRLLVGFLDGTRREYDLTPLLQRIPAFAPLRTVPGLFGQVSVDPGGCGVSWNDEIDLDCGELWAHGTPLP